MSGTLIAATTRDHIVQVNQDISYVVPNTSPVRYQAAADYDTVDWSGQFELTGNYSYGYLSNDPKDDSYKQRELSFTISRQQAERLPYWQTPKRLPAITEIQIRNPDRFADHIISAKDLERLRAREILSVDGTATIEVRNLRTTIVCDHQEDSVEFVRPHSIEGTKVALVVVDEPAC